jgi:class 3 adenylate cyclase
MDRIIPWKMNKTTPTEGGAARWRFPFKYKLALSIAVILLGVLSGTFLVLQARIEANAVESIKADLQTTRQMVIGLIEERSARLHESARSVGGSELVRIILTDLTLDRLTADDIVAEEVMPRYPQLSLISVADHQGRIRASSALGAHVEYVEALSSPSRQGRVGLAFLRIGPSYQQVTTLPVFVGPRERREVLGVVGVGMAWTAGDLVKIRTLSGADIALLAGEGIVAGAGPAFDAADKGNPRPPGGIPFNRVSTVSPEIHAIGGERHVLLRIEAHGTAGAPDFVIARSLDAQLAFVNEIRRIMIQFGLLGIAVGLAVSLAMATGIARPIRTLTAVARHIARDNYTLQVHVRSHDEFAELGAAFNQMIAGLRERDLIRDTFGRYVDREVAQKLLSRPESLHMGGQKRDVVIMMADIRGFSHLSEQISPEATVLLLNHYFARMIGIIKQHGGVVVDFVGDGLLAFFDPLDSDAPTAAGMAVACAFQMQRQLAEVNEEMARDELPRLAIGIGLNTGPAIVGNIGSKERAKYGIVGAEVNLTQRIQGEAGPGEVVLSEPMFALVRESVAIHRQFERALKGFRNTRCLFSVTPREPAGEGAGTASRVSTTLPTCSFSNTPQSLDCAHDS